MSVRALRTYAEQYYNSLKPKCFADVFVSPTCSIGKYKRLDGETKARAVMGIILSDLVDFFNVSQSMNPPQMAQVIDMILDTYGYLKIEDFRLCFNWAKRGFYGQVFRIDGNVILTWLEKYVDDRCNNADEENYSKHSGLKAGERNSPDLDTIIKNNTKKYR